MNPDRLIIACDTGVNGGLCLYNATNGFVVDSWYVPTVTIQKSKRKVKKIDLISLSVLLHDCFSLGATEFYIEKVNAMPNQGVVSVFSFGEAFGSLKGCAVSSGLKVIEVRPQDWKKFFELGRDKDESLDLARSRFSECSFPLKKDHNRAEACLIALWASLQDDFWGSA